jgi:hypothetical protein
MLRSPIRPPWNVRWVNSEDDRAHGAEKYLSGVDG